MNFLQIQEAVLSDRFDETKRASAKIWINSRYGRLWSMEPWSFKIVKVDATVNSGQDVSMFGQFQKIFSVYDEGQGVSFAPMMALRPEDFYQYSTTQSYRPDAFTFIDGVLRFNRPVATTTNYTIVGEKSFVSLVNDNDEPLIPPEFHYMLVHGASSEGLRAENDPTWQGFEQDWQANIADMRQSYLASVKNYTDHQPAWP